MEKNSKNQEISPKREKKWKSITTAVTTAQHFIIKQKARQAGVNLSEYMRQMAIDGQLISRWSEEERQIFKKLVEMSNGINQLARNAQKEGTTNIMLYFNQYRDRIDEVVKQLSHDT